MVTGLESRWLGITRFGRLESGEAVDVREEGIRLQLKGLGSWWGARRRGVGE